MPERIESHNEDRDQDYQRKREASFIHALGAAPALALTAFSLAVASMLGATWLSGSTYLDASTDDEGNQTTSGAVQVTLLGAALAASVVLLSYIAWRRSVDDSPAWVRPVALAATLVALASLVGRIALALLETQGHRVPYL